LTEEYFKQHIEKPTSCLSIITQYNALKKWN